MAGTKTNLACLTPPPALKQAPTVSHAYLALQIDRDKNGEFHLPPFDPFLLQGQVIDVSVFTNRDARRCFEQMVQGNSSLKQSWERIAAAVEYFRGEGNTDNDPNHISWGELVAGYKGRDQELRNAFINITSAARILQERSIDDGLASFREQMRRGMVAEAKGKFKEALEQYEAVFYAMPTTRRKDAETRLAAEAAFAAARMGEKIADHLNDGTANGKKESLIQYATTINWYNYVPPLERARFPELQARLTATTRKLEALKKNQVKK